MPLPLLNSWNSFSVSLVLLLIFQSTWSVPMWRKHMLFFFFWLKQPIACHHVFQPYIFLSRDAVCTCAYVCGFITDFRIRLTCLSVVTWNSQILTLQTYCSLHSKSIVSFIFGSSVFIRSNAEWKVKCHSLFIWVFWNSFTFIKLVK